MKNIKQITKMTVNGIDIFLLQVQLGNRKGWMSVWCNAGFDVERVIEYERKRLIMDVLDGLDGYFLFGSPQVAIYDFNTFEAWFPNAGSLQHAEKAFKQMVKFAETVNINIHEPAELLN